MAWHRHCLHASMPRGAAREDRRRRRTDRDREVFGDLGDRGQEDKDGLEQTPTTYLPLPSLPPSFSFGSKR